MTKNKEIELADIIGDENTQIKQPKEINTVKTSNKKPIIVSVILTLFTVATLGGMFYLGVRYESSKYASIKAEATKIVAELKTNE